MKPSHDCSYTSQWVGGLITERKLKSPPGAPRIVEKPRRHSSSARCVRDPMIRAIALEVVEHVVWREESRLGAQNRSSLFLIIPYWTHGHNLLHTSCAPWPAGQLGAGRLHYRRVNDADPASRQVGISLVWKYIFYSFFLRSKPGLRFVSSYSSRNSSRCLRS